jgi:ABC-type dipeptide/oligopeptide/nickel transport system permease subunit
MRLADGLLAFPGLLLVLVLSAVMGPGPPALILGLTLLGWPMIARLVCNETLRLAQRDFVPAARAIGAGNTRILLRHILPNTLRPVLAMVPLLATIIMLAEASLSFLGLGVQPPLPSWGSLIRDMTPRLQTHLPLLLYPAAALSLTIVALNYLAEWVQDRLDPISRFR